MFSFFYAFKKSELALLMASLILIAIWPMRDTIAARNILLVVCTLISFFYLYKNFRLLVWNQKQVIKNWMPIILVALLFIWVIIHYFFFSYDPVAQFKELTSTWLRSAMAAIVGFTIGLLINRREKYFDLVMLALIVGFVMMFGQYVNLLFQTHELYQRMHWNSIYWGKINEVLMGTLFIAGVLGLLEISFFRFPAGKISGGGGAKRLASYLIGVILVLHCYVFEIDTRNGVGIVAILVLIFIGKSAVKLFSNWRAKDRTKRYRDGVLVILILLGTIIFFGRQHIQNNAGWKTYIEDVQIALQVDRYSNWQTIPATPIFSPTGRLIPGNTYERTAWVKVAIRMIDDHPWGYGLIHNAFRHWGKLDYPKSDLTISHSGWLDFALSFGVLGAALLVGSLLWTLGLSIAGNASLAPMAFWCSLGLFFVYALVEIMYYHGLEILIFWLAFLPAILFPLSRDKL